MLNLNKKVNIAIVQLLILSLMLISVPSFTLQANAATDNDLFANAQNDFAGETILNVYVENNELYVVTDASNDMIGPGKCPSSSKTISKTYTRQELIDLKTASKRENAVKFGIAGIAAGYLGVPASLIAMVIGYNCSGVAGDIENILDHSTKSKITVEASFTCTSKGQAGTWSHVWKLSGMKVK